jgi:putative ABC transport system permease protein
VNKHFARALAKLWDLVSSRKADRDFEREIEAHLEFLEQDYLQQGLTPAEARRRARLALDGIEPIRQAQRDERSFLWLSQAGQDLRHAVRSIGRAPGFTLCAVVTLALGIGSNTAVFSVVNAVLIRPLSYPDPSRIVQFFLSSSEGLTPGASIPDLRFLVERVNSVEDIAAYDFDQSEMGFTSGTPDQVHGIHVTSNYFRLLGAPVLLGRTLAETDNLPNGPRVVVLSYGLWKRRFAGDQNIIGQMISLDKESYAVIGVAGKGFNSNPEAQLWIPFQFDLNSTDQFHSFAVAARLKAGVTLEQANAQLDAVSQSARHLSELPDPDYRLQLRRLHDAMVGDIRASLLTLQGAVGLVLLIAYANLANLLLARAIVRKREFAIRTAIGALAGRIIRQLIVESLLLSSIGCLLGVVGGLAGVHLLLKIIPGGIPRVTGTEVPIGLDWRVMAFAVGLSIATALVFGILPALQVLRERLVDSLHETSGRHGLGARSKWLHSVTVVSEVALSLVLLIAASLLVRTFMLLNRVDPGFDSHNLLMMTMSMRGEKTGTPGSLAAMIRNGCQELTAIPGVTAAAATFSPPFANRMGLPFISLSVTPAISGDGEWIAASPGYFRVLKIPILRGRDFDEHDHSGTSPVVMINETMARRYWPQQNALGQQILIGKGLGPKFEDRPRTIIGVFADTRDNDLADIPQPTMAIPDAQAPTGIIDLMSQFGPIWWMVRTNIEPHQFIPSISENLRSASGGRPVGNVRTMDDLLAGSIAKQNFNMLLLAIFAATALLLAAVGVYGVMAYSVAQRTHEVGVRMALGAGRMNVRNMILREGLTKGTLGVICGAGAAFFLARLLESLLFGVSSHDAAVFFAAPLVLEVIIAIATFIPAQRAASLDPSSALRFE